MPHSQQRDPQRKGETRAVSVEGYFRELGELIPRLPFADIEAIAAAIRHACQEGRTIFVFGNGGSAATASHSVCDLAKGTIQGDRRLKVISLNDNVPLLTAWANDCGYDQVFAGQLRNFVQPRDVVFAISGSGKSRNIVEALKTARAAGAITVGIAGFDGGEMPALCDICAVVPSDSYQLIEDVHHAIAHSIFSVLKEQLSPAAKPAEKKNVAAAGI